VNTDTYNTLPTDVAAGLWPGSVRLDASIPRGAVDVTSQGGTTRMPVNSFIRARRKARKAQRQNRKAGRS
jgi:hypothetical protein